MLSSAALCGWEQTYLERADGVISQTNHVDVEEVAVLQEQNAVVLEHVQVYNLGVSLHCEK